MEDGGGRAKGGGVGGDGEGGVGGHSLVLHMGVENLIRTNVFPMQAFIFQPENNSNFTAAARPPVQNNKTRTEISFSYLAE